MSEQPQLNLSQPVAGPAVGLLSASSLTQLVNSAFRNYQSTLALSRSPLANSALVTPTLILDDVSPTAEERGRGLRLILRWAVEQIAPHAPTHPLGDFRPYDDPTWSDPLWWRYNILRHRYVEPLHPDDFIGGRYTETIMALTGITSSDAFFDERGRAIQEVAERLRQQLIDGAGNQSLQQMALSEAMKRLEGHEEASLLLGIASTFDDVFPRSLLLTMAEAEQLRHPEQLLDYLITNRLLLAGDERQNLWLAPTFRLYIYQRQSHGDRRRRHRTIARDYSEQEEPLITAKHWQIADMHEQAATLLLKSADTLINELQIPPLIQLLQQFDDRALPIDSWREIQILLSDLYQRTGQAEEALLATRSALKVATQPIDQARIYRRMGKLYVTRNQLHALGYYQQAVERLSDDAPELADVLKDRAWLHILRRNWDQAEQDLLRAQALVAHHGGEDDAELRADIYDALASLYRRQTLFPPALEQAQAALALREQLGNLPRIASSFNNIGLTYRHMGEYGHAISAYEEALVTYRKIGNGEATAGALMNIGNAYFQLGRLQDAIETYQQSLQLAVNLAQPHLEATIHYNLAEAYAATEDQQLALDHWQRGYALSQRSGFADEVEAFEQLRAETALLQQSTAKVRQTPPPKPALSVSGGPLLPPEEQAVIELAMTYGRITAKVLTEALDLSRATATRRLRALAEAGHLVQQGKGRGTHYVLSAPEPSTASSSRPSGLHEKMDDHRTDIATVIERRRLTEALAELQNELEETFRVTALTAAAPLSPQLPPTVRVRFQETPSLQRFFDLREHLTQQLGYPIDLWPER